MNLPYTTANLWKKICIEKYEGPLEQIYILAGLFNILVH